MACIYPILQALDLYHLAFVLFNGLGLVNFKKQGMHRMLQESDQIQFRDFFRWDLQLKHVGASVLLIPFVITTWVYIGFYPGVEGERYILQVSNKALDIILLVTISIYSFMIVPGKAAALGV